MRKPPQKLITAVMVHDRLRDHRAEPRHAIGKPFRYLAAMQRKICASGSSNHSVPGPFVDFGSLKHDRKRWEDD
jgi:hypothetical protein